MYTLELEKKESSNCDFCIQHILPHHLIGAGGFKKNIAFLEAESLSIKELCWFNHLQQMDEIWVPNQDLANSLVTDEIGLPVKVVHHATDIEKFKKSYRLPSMPMVDDTFKFYYIGDLNDRKNIGCISTCFHSEFDKSEDVSLIIKVRKFGRAPEQTQLELDQILSSHKISLRIYKSIQDYKKEIVVTEEINDQDLHGMHSYADCFILPSHGEAWSIPALDALGFGNTPICSNFGGPKEFIEPDNKYTGTLIDGVFSCCKCSDAAFSDMFTGKEYWFQPCEKLLREQMREYYELYKKDPVKYKQETKEVGLSRVEKFSHKNIGEKMLEVLNES